MVIFLLTTLRDPYEATRKVRGFFFRGSIVAAATCGASMNLETPYLQIFETPDETYALGVAPLAVTEANEG